jgi:DNA-directed RNA polymerase subunit RPC12/RpoP
LKNRRRVSRDATAIRAIADHVRTYVGMVDQVLEADSSDLLPVDLHLVAPRRDLPIRVAVTSGMSNHPMNTPRGAEDERHMELVLGLEPNWPVSKEALSQDHRAWPLEWLRKMACLPHSLDTWLGVGHTVPNGDPPQPLGPGTEMCGWILLPPIWLPEEFGTLVMHETKTVYFYALLPLYREEMDFKLQQGAEALFERLSQLPMLGLFDFQRPNVCKATVSLACAACRTPFETPAEMAGQRVACPHCGGAVIVPRRGFYDEKQRSVTLDDQSTASLPGNVKVNPIQYVTHFPLWPILWAGSLVATGVAALLTMNIALIIIAFMLLAANALYWYRVKEHFLHGCINPAVVVSTNPLLIAVSTDLTTGWKPWPVVKILPHPLRSIGGQPPQIGMRLSTVALYQSGGNDDSHWVDFHPKAVECVTTDEASIQYTMSQLDEDAWQDLHRKLMKVPRPFRAGLYHTPDE